ARPRTAPSAARLEEGSGDSGVEPDRSLLSKEQRDQRISLFLRDFDHQAKENLQDLKKELASLLQVAEKAFRVELLAMPTVVRKMRRKDLIGNCTCAFRLPGAASCPPDAFQMCGSLAPAVTTIVEYKDEKEGNKTQAKKASQKVREDRCCVMSILASWQRAFCQLGGTAVLKSSPTLPWFLSRFAQRVPSKSASASGRIQATSVRSTSMPLERHVPFVNIPLADGQTLCSAGEDLQNINVELLNDDTVQHIHTLVVSMQNKPQFFPSRSSFLELHCLNTQGAGEALEGEGQNLWRKSPRTAQ
uniref:BORE2 protein n=1 Tax=Varanus komodoensis TaxID=61221 RepID=A0A8D2IS94_VARKO